MPRSGKARDKHRGSFHSDACEAPPDAFQRAVLEMAQPQGAGGKLYGIYGQPDQKAIRRARAGMHAKPPVVEKPRQRDPLRDVARQRAAADGREAGASFQNGLMRENPRGHGNEEKHPNLTEPPAPPFRRSELTISEAISDETDMEQAGGRPQDESACGNAQQKARVPLEDSQTASRHSKQEHAQYSKQSPLQINEQRHHLSMGGIPLHVPGKTWVCKARRRIDCEGVPDG